MQRNRINIHARGNALLVWHRGPLSKTNFHTEEEEKKSATRMQYWLCFFCVCGCVRVCASKRLIHITLVQYKCISYP